MSDLSGHEATMPAPNGEAGNNQIPYNALPADNGQATDPMQKLKEMLGTATPSKSETEAAAEAELDADLATLLDPNSTALKKPDAPRDENGMPDAFKDLAESIRLATGGDDKPATPMDALFNEIYGDEIPFEEMMAEDGDPKEIAEKLQASVKEKIKNSFASVIQQSLQLSEQLIDKKLNEYKGTVEAANIGKTAVTAMEKEMPFTSADPNGEFKGQYSGMANLILTTAMEKSGNDVQKSVALVKHLFKKNNPNLFATDNSRRFSEPNSQRDDGQGTALTLDNLADFINT